MTTFLRGKKHPSGEDVEIEYNSGHSAVIKRKVLVPNAQLIDLVANPVEIVESPGEGMYIFPLALTISSIGSTPADSGSILYVSVAAEVGQMGFALGPVIESIPPWTIPAVGATNLSGTSIFLNIENQPMRLYNYGSDVSITDADWLVTVLYSILDLP